MMAGMVLGGNVVARAPRGMGPVLRPLVFDYLTHLSFEAWDEAFLMSDAQIWQVHRPGFRAWMANGFRFDPAA